ncbi:hypothetical protein GCM10009639_60700 [Kitasatospora putterlickiae]|uniref:Secreted protein n=1 Tax=Kitasatospora putterlickiae TaxID=221725 RepID=A0ABP4J861_9ACTN
MIDSTSLTSNATMLWASLSAAAWAATLMSSWLCSVAVTVFFRLGGLGRPVRGAPGIAFQDLTPSRRPRNRFPGPPARPGTGYWGFGGV